MASKLQSEVQRPKSEVQGCWRRTLWHRPRISDVGLRTLLLLVALFAAVVARADGPHKLTVETLGNEVQCTCGCVAPLNQCPHLDCAQKAEIRAFIQKEIDDGKDEATILQDLSHRYGVRVLMSPPARGFNLAVWILPGASLLAGFGVVVVIVRRWQHRPGAQTASSAPLDPRVLAALETEMKSAGMK